MGRFTENGSAELYYDNVLRLSTTNTGVTITAEAVVGNGTNGLQFSHSTGNSSGIINTGFSSTAVEIRTGNVQRMLINSTSATFAGNVSLLDSKFLNLGSNNDLKIYHNSTASFINNETGDLNIANYADNKDIRFYSDDGAGSVTEYFRLDGLNGRINFSVDAQFADNKKVRLGSSADLQLYHTGSESNILNLTGNLNISNDATDGDIIFKSDDGSGGLATYFYLDGAQQVNFFSKNAKFNDNVSLLIGGGNDLQILHDSNHSYIKNYTGDLYIENFADDKDIIFKSDDGSGGIATYFYIDGSAVLTRVTKSFLFEDNIKAIYGGGSDLQIYHSGTDSFINNDTGDIYIKNFANDKDIIFQSDDGSGGVATYFYLDGSNSFTNFQLNARWQDNAQAQFGNSGDLRIYHDGSNSYINEVGTGDLIVKAVDDVYIKGNTHDMARFNEQGVKLYHIGNVKLETKSTGINVLGVTEYADNTAAIAGGLITGDVYRTGDLLKIVH